MKSVRFLILGALVSLALLITGCATASKPEAMVVGKIELAKKHAATLSLKVTGGSETSSAGSSKISNADFTTALTNSITSSELFSKLLDAASSDYHLDVMIARLDQPMMGFNMTVTLETNWKLTRKSDGSVVWQRAIPSTFKATMDDAFAGVTRLRLANEGAARTNIEAALKEMAALDL
jgi:hypothetical protein